MKHMRIEDAAVDDETAAMSGTSVAVEVLDQRRHRLVDAVEEERGGFSSREPYALCFLA